MNSDYLGNILKLSKALNKLNNNFLNANINNIFNILKINIKDLKTIIQYLIKSIPLTKNQFIDLNNLFNLNYNSLTKKKINKNIQIFDLNDNILYKILNYTNLSDINNFELVSIDAAYIGRSSLSTINVETIIFNNYTTFNYLYPYPLKIKQNKKILFSRFSKLKTIKINLYLSNDIKIMFTNENIIHFLFYLLNNVFQLHITFEILENNNYIDMHKHEIFKFNFQNYLNNVNSKLKALTFYPGGINMEIVQFLLKKNLNTLKYLKIPMIYLRKVNVYLILQQLNLIQLHVQYVHFTERELFVLENINVKILHIHSNIIPFISSWMNVLKKISYVIISIQPTNFFDEFMFKNLILNLIKLKNFCVIISNSTHLFPNMEEYVEYSKKLNITIILKSYKIFLFKKGVKMYNPPCDAKEFVKIPLFVDKNNIKNYLFS